MQFSESWLRTLVNPSLSGEELAHLLTMAGLEVEEIKPVASAFDKVVVGHVLSVEHHPGADRLKRLKVDAGQSLPLDIVCGAPNVTPGMKAPCALVGAKLPGMEIRQATVRGVESFGMMCSARELGLSGDDGGLMVLPAHSTPGQDLRTCLDLDDHVLTLKLTPNRSDCLSLCGIAREVAALTGAPLQYLPPLSFAQDETRTQPARVLDHQACPRYAGRVITGVNARAATPAWMVRRLERSGLRSISAIVDVTNYVLLELGQPLHAFDLDKVRGGIEVRWARSGETLLLLNQQQVELRPDMLVIADQSGPVALAGVMGGAESAVSDGTETIFLESAFFAPEAIAGRTRRLGVSSDSSYRFERGVDFSRTVAALDRATQLILELCGGHAGPVREQCAELPVRRPVNLRVPRVQRVLGIRIGQDEIGQILERLGMTVLRQPGSLQVTPPSYRFDIAIEEDLIEEIARVYGYERIPPLPPHAAMTMLPQPEATVPLSQLRRRLVMRDYQEAINYAFVAADLEHNLHGNARPVTLQNPIASHQSVMRSSLLGGLLGSLAANLARRQPRVRLFEMGACFAVAGQGYVQHERLAGLCYGTDQPEQWGRPARNVDFFDIKGDIESLFAPRALRYVAQPHPASHPGRSARIYAGNQPVGWIGELHPASQRAYDLPQPAVWFELDLPALLLSSVPAAADVSRFPPVWRDIAVVVDENLTAQFLLDTLNAEHAPFVAELALFDQYRGTAVEKGKKSLAFRVLLQDTQKTLTETEIESSTARLVSALQRHGAKLRT